MDKNEKHIKHLKKEIAQIKKQIKRNNKRQQVFDSEETAEEFLKETIEEKQIIKEEICPKCGDDLEVIAGGERVKVYMCVSCTYRTSKRK